MGQVLASYGSKGGRLGFILVLMEPLMMIVAVYLIKDVFRGFTGTYGTSAFLFLASGFLPYYLFMHLSSRSQKAGRKRSVFPRLSALDMYIATVLVNTITWLSMIVLAFWLMWLSGLAQARPASMVNWIAPLSLLIVLAVGIGMINAVVGRYFPLWLTIYGFATYGLVFISGVLHVIETQPMLLRLYSIYNPLQHGITWFRMGVYGEQYPHNFLDRDYLIKFALVALFVGFVLDRATIRRRDQ